MTANKGSIFKKFCGVTIFLFAFAIAPSFVLAQVETPPEPSAPRPVKVPFVNESQLPNGIKIAVVEKHSSPLVTVQFLLRAGVNYERNEQAGIAKLTATMLTKGTKTRSATKIAEDIAFLGGTMNADAGGSNSVVTLTVTSDKLDQAMAILADVVLNPKFDEKELELLKTQTLDGLAYSLKQPSSLANYVASKYSFHEHPAGGTPESIRSITTADIKGFYDLFYGSANSILIFAGDITPTKAAALGERYFSGMRSLANYGSFGGSSPTRQASSLGRILVVDLPNSGQAAVGYYVKSLDIWRNSAYFYPASVMNSILGGGYSSRLNQEIRIKRGLSYGAGSSIVWQEGANFSSRAQTKNESAAEVASLVLAEIDKMKTNAVAARELGPRKAVLIGGFGRGLETTSDLAKQLGVLYAHGTPVSTLNDYVGGVEAVSPEQVEALADKLFVNGDLIIVGDYSVFKDDLAKRFPQIKVQVIKADLLDLSEPTLQKRQ